MPNQEEWKIWPPYEALYIESLLTITKTAIDQYEILDQIITDQEFFDKNPMALLDLSQNIVNQAAILSRYFWPVKKGRIHQLRGEKLRNAFSLDDTNPLKNREFRNFIEHFDENLDEFVDGNVAGSIFINRVVFNSAELNEVTFVFRAYVVNEFKFISLSREVFLIPIIKEIYRIHNLLIEFSDKGGRLPK